MDAPTDCLLSTRYSVPSTPGGAGSTAEGEGFEPSKRFHLHAFQACALGQTMRPLRRMGSVEAKGQVLDWDTAMGEALEEAAQAPRHGDIPIGAILLDRDGNVVARERNRREERGDATAHAEMLVLAARSRDLGDWHLDGHTLVVTLEPCAMCAMAAVWSRVDRIVYGAADPKAGAVWSLFNIPQDERLNHRCEIVASVRADEAASLLREFFASHR